MSFPPPDIEKTLQELDHVIGFYNVACQVKGVVKERPSSVGVPQYLQAMDRLAETCRYFEQNKPQSVEIENLVTISFFSPFKNVCNPILEVQRRGRSHCRQV